MRISNTIFLAVTLLCIAKFAGAQTDEETEEPTMEIEFSTLGNPEFPVLYSDESQYIMGPDDTISVDFPGEEVRTIIRNVADIYDLNVFIPDELHGTTWIKLRNVNWQEVFTVILEPLGYAFRQEGNLVYIEPRQDNIIHGIRDNTLYILSSTLLISLGLNVFLVMRKPAAK